MLYPSVSMDPNLNHIKLFYLFQIPSPKYMNKVNNARNLELPKQSSHNSLRKKYSCDCPNQMCINCPKLAEANLNNNNLTNINNNNTIMGSNPNMLSVSRARGKLRQQSSSQGSFESSSNSPCLSRGKCHRNGGFSIKPVFYFRFQRSVRTEKK